MAKTIGSLERAFAAHKGGSKKRNIEFHFSFEEWMQWWMTDDRYLNRGRGRNQFVMARFGDVGPYAPDNVYLATGEENARDYRQSEKRLVDQLVRSTSRRTRRPAKQRAAATKDHVKSACDKIAAGLNDDIAVQNGDDTSGVLAPVDVKAVRARTGMSQRDFAIAFRLPLGTVRDWEQLRNTPDSGSAMYLKLIRANPTAVLGMLSEMR